MRKLKLKNFPPAIRQYQGTIGNTDTGNIQKLIRLASHPESVSFESHNTFITDDDLSSQIEREEVDPKKDVEELDLDDKMHSGIFTGARTFNSSQVRVCQLCGFQAHNPA